MSPATAARALWLACTAACAVAACAPERAEPGARESGASVVTRTDSFGTTVPVEKSNCLAYNLLRVAATRAALRDAFGEPDTVESTPEPNPHTPGRIDTVHIVRYPGLVASLFTVTGDRELVSALTITDNRFLADPTIGIGAQVDDLIEKLGEPEDRTDTAITYDCPDDADSPVVFRLDQNVVTAIEVSYYTG